MFCRKCGTRIPDNAKFCPSCGEPCSVGRRVSEIANDAFNSGEQEIVHEIHDRRKTFDNDVPTPPVGRQRLKDDRGLFIYIVLTIITCGIYNYYFVYRLAQDTNTVCEGDGEQTSGLVAFILLSIITCGIYSYYWYYKLGNRLSSNARSYNLAFQENGTTILLWQLFGMLLFGIGPFVAMHIIIKNINALCNAYNRKYGLT